MLPVSVRLTALPFVVAVLAVLGWPAAALANHHHIGGSGSGGDDINADCLVWGYVFLDGGAADRADAADAAAADAGMTDAGDGADAAQPVDAATIDAGSAVPAGAVLVCLEHATLFGCDCAVGPAARDGWSQGAVALLAATLLVARRRRRTARRGGTP